MCSKEVILVVLCVVVGLTAGFTIRDKVNKKEAISASFQTLTGYRKRLQNQGLVAETKQQNAQDVRNFDELDLLQLIPVTIKQLRHDLLSAEERRALHNIFGEMWTLMAEDSRRKRNEPRDAVLSVLLNSREVRLGKTDINQHFKNDIEGNSVQKVYNAEDSRPIQLSDDLSVEPSQRLLRMVAAIVQKAYKDLAERRPASTTPKKIRSKRSNSINLENVKVTIHMPRVKRSPLASIPLKSTIGLTAEEKRRIEEANEAAIMEAVLAQIAGNNLDEEDEDKEEYEEEYEEEPKAEKTAVAPKLGEIEEDDDDDDDDADDGGDDLRGAMPDYAYDDTAGSDDYFLDEYKPRYSGGDFENPSVNELIMLASKHRTQRRSDSGIRASSYRTASEEYEY